MIMHNKNLIKSYYIICNKIYFYIISFFLSPVLSLYHFFPVIVFKIMTNVCSLHTSFKVHADNGRRTCHMVNKNTCLNKSIRRVVKEVVSCTEWNTHFKILTILKKCPPKMILIKLNLSPVISNGLLLLNSYYFLLHT